MKSSNLNNLRNLCAVLIILSAPLTGNAGAQPPRPSVPQKKVDPFKYTSEELRAEKPAVATTADTSTQTPTVSAADFYNDALHEPAAPTEAPFRLEPGTYVVETLTKKDASLERQHLFVAPDINEDSSVFALLVSYNATKSYREYKPYAYFYHGRYLAKRKTYLLIPILIDNNGNPTISTEIAENPPVIEITMRPGRWDHPYLFTGRNGAFNGATYGMYAKTRTNPRFDYNIVKGVFLNEDRTRTVNLGNGELAFSSINETFQRIFNQGETFKIKPLNGLSITISGLMRSQMNGMAEGVTFNEDVEKLMMFATGGCFEKDSMLILTPNFTEKDATKMGRYDLEVLKPENPKLLEYIFPNARTPHQKQL